MFQAKPLRISALLVSLSLAAALLGCSPKTPTVPDSPLPPDPEPVITPEPEPPEPEKTLTELFEASAGELQARFEASPLSSLEKFFSHDGLSAVFQGSLVESGLAFTGDLVFDRVSGAALARLAAKDGGPQARIYCDDGFVGVSCQPLFGDERFYGLRPSGFCQQLGGTALASLLSLDMEALAELDRLLDAVPEDIFSNPTPLSQSLLDVTRRLIASHAFERTPEGAAEGYAFTASIPDAEMAGYLRELAEGRQELAILLCLASGVRDIPDIDGAIDGLEASGGHTDLAFYTDKERVLRLEASFEISGTEVLLEAELSGGAEGDTLYVKMDPFFNLELTPGPDLHMALYAHMGDGSTTTLDLTGDGTLDFITYSTDITTLALDGTLSAGEDALAFTGVWSSGNRGDLNPLTFTCAPGDGVSAPEEKILLTDMTERQLFLIVTRAVLKAL